MSGGARPALAQWAIIPGAGVGHRSSSVVRVLLCVTCLKTFLTVDDITWVLQRDVCFDSKQEM